MFMTKLDEDVVVQEEVPGMVWALKPKYARAPAPAPNHRKGLKLKLLFLFRHN